jgi:hypothetical protein
MQDNALSESGNKAAGGGQCGWELGTTVERIGPLSGLRLDVLVEDIHPLQPGEARHGCALGIDPRPERCCCLVETR